MSSILKYLRRLRKKDKQTEEYVYCPCGHKATYRGEWRRKTYGQVADPALDKHRVATLGLCVQYLTCDRCATDEIKERLHHHADGWTQKKWVEHYELVEPKFI